MGSRKVKPETVWREMDKLQVLFRRFLVQEGWTQRPDGDWLHPVNGSTYNVGEAIYYEMAEFKARQIIS